MTINEPEIEKLAISLLEKRGYQHIYAPDIAPDSDNPLRNGFDDVLLEKKLKSAIDRINPDISPEVREDAIRQVRRIHSPELIVGNEEFYIMLTEGVNITTRGSKRKPQIFPKIFK